MLTSGVLHASTMRLHMTDPVQSIMIILDIMVHSSNELCLVGTESA